MKQENKILAIVLGIGLIIFGIFIFSQPLTTLLSIILYMAWAVLIRGLFFLYDCYKSYKNKNHLDHSELIYGIALSIIGIILLLNPQFTGALIFYLVAFWFMFDGIMGILRAIKRSGAGKWIGIVLGALLVWYGVSIAIEPLRAIFALNILMGMAIITNGMQMIALSCLKD